MEGLLSPQKDLSSPSRGLLLVENLFGLSKAQRHSEGVERLFGALDGGFEPPEQSSEHTLESFRACPKAFQAC